MRDHFLQLHGLTRRTRAARHARRRGSLGLPHPRSMMGPRPPAPAPSSLQATGAAPFAPRLARVVMACTRTA
jgi:hypothetical protein